MQLTVTTLLARCPRPTWNLARPALAWTFAGALGLVVAACSDPEAVAPTYAGSCPILVECAAELDDDRVPELLSAYGDPATTNQGSCWASGQANHEECRSSCVDALIQLNLDLVGLGRSCGDCTDDSDCTRFGARATCEAGYCARPELGDLDLEISEDSESETGPLFDIPDGPTELPLDEACEGPNPRVVLETTLGTMTVELDTVASPQASKLFLQHVSAGFYDEVLFHRVVDGALLQAGGFRPGRVLASPLATASHTTAAALEHAPGVLAMVKTNNSVGAQFYLVDAPGPAGDGAGIPIGALVAGADVRDAISAVEVIDVEWMGFTLFDLPLVEVVIEQASCE